MAIIIPDDIRKPVMRAMCDDFLSQRKNPQTDPINYTRDQMIVSLDSMFKSLMGPTGSGAGGSLVTAIQSGDPSLPLAHRRHLLRQLLAVLVENY